MADASESVATVVEDFLTAIAERDFDRAMQCISVRSLEFVGPSKSYRGGETLRQDLELLYPILAKMQRRRLFVDGCDACVIYDLCTTVPGMELIRLAEWITVNHGLITRMEVFYDTHAYAQLLESGSAEFQSR